MYDQRSLQALANARRPPLRTVVGVGRGDRTPARRDDASSPYLRQAFYRELAGRLRRLGYEPDERTTAGFSIRGVEHLRERFSKRAHEVKVLTEAFSVKKGRRATRREVKVLVRESRGKELSEITTPEVRSRHRAELTPDEEHRLERLVRETMV